MLIQAHENKSPHGNSEKRNCQHFKRAQSVTMPSCLPSHGKHCQIQVYASSPCQTEGILLLLHNHKMKLEKPRWSLLPRHLPASDLNPGPHAWHLNEPCVFTHLPLGQTPGLLHSSTSVQQREKGGYAFTQLDLIR